jgi:hypothetical protein
MTGIGTPFNGSIEFKASGKGACIEPNVYRIKLVTYKEKSFRSLVDGRK